MSDTEYPIQWQENFVHDIGRFREWLGQRDDLVLGNGTPVWWHLVHGQGWQNLEELLALSPSEYNVYLDWKDDKSRGWMWTTLSFHAPYHLVLSGLERLGHGWDHKDVFGVDPLSLALEGQCIHGIARRLWREAPMTSQQRLRTLASSAPTPSASRAWRFWIDGIEFDNEPGQ